MKISQADVDKVLDAWSGCLGASSDHDEGSLTPATSTFPNLPLPYL